MKKTVLRYGLFSALFMTVFFLLDEFLIADKLGTDNREILGYIGIFISTLFVYFGARYYRDQYNNGELSFGQALKVGLLIVLFPSVVFGIFNVIYIILHPEFLDSYYAPKIAAAKLVEPAAEAAKQVAAIESEREMFRNPAIQFAFMFLTVFAIGLIVTVISAFLLRRGKQPRYQTA